MSVKLNIWNGLKIPLAALKTAGTINHYAIWNNQIDNENVEIPLEFPAVFVEFRQMQWNLTGVKPALGNQLQQQMGTEWVVTLHIVFENYNNETSSFEANDSILDSIIAKIHLLEIDEFVSILLRSEERQDVDHNNVIHWEIDFHTRVQETIADTQTDVTDGDEVTIDLVINRDLDIDSQQIRTGYDN